MSIETQLDHRPLRPFHWWVTLVAGLSVMFNAMDLALVAYLVAGLSQRWNLGPDQARSVLVIGFVGMAAGAALAGLLADRYGRRPVLIGSLLLGSIATGLAAVAPGLPALLAVRFLAGVGLGGGLPVASTLVAEVAPAGRRGLLVMLLASFWGWGSVLAALIGLVIVPRFGWQVGCLIGGLPALAGLVLRRWLPESPRFLLRAGRLTEAAALLGRMGAPPTGQQLQVAATGRAEGMLARSRWLWRPELARRTLLLWVLWCGVIYAIFGVTMWLPPLLADRGFPIVQNLGGVLLTTVAQVPGAIGAAWLVDRLGRKWTLVGYLALFGATALLFGQFGLVAGAPLNQPIVWSALVQFFSLGAWGIIAAATTERYPTVVRGTGSGWAAAAGWLGGIAGLFVMLWLLDPVGLRLDARLVLAQFAATSLVLAVLVAVLGEETGGRSLEQISGEERPTVPASRRWVN